MIPETLTAFLYETSIFSPGKGFPQFAFAAGKWTMDKHTDKGLLKSFFKLQIFSLAIKIVPDKSTRVYFKL
jgi:hypothetical protein